VNRPGWLGFEILHPAWAAVLLAVPLVLALGWWGLRARARARLALVSQRQLVRFLPLFSENRARLRVALAGAGALFLALALLGPVRGFTLRDVQRKGLDLVLCLDTSRSMLVQDIKPDRLTRAKREINGLLAVLEGDRAALLSFAGDVRDVAPLTHDRETLALFVDAQSPEDNLRGGTDIGAVLEQALALFDGRTGAHEAIVLLTDGEDLEGRGLAVARKAQERGIHVYVVGMGTLLGGKIPDGRGFLRDEQGQEVVSALDGKSLQQIAELTGGAYLSAEGAAFPLQEIYEKRIAKLETRELFAGKERIPHDRYQWPLVLGALSLLGASGLRERRAREPRSQAAALPQRGAA
jgi:Ca-activated chloride channel family protein